MSSAIEAPHQYKQPSRKGKKAWRKNVDVTDVQEGLRQLKEEEIKGYVLSLLVVTSDERAFYADCTVFATVACCPRSRPRSCSQ